MTKSETSQVLKAITGHLYWIARRNGCMPFWSNGIYGPMWHCGCDDEAHFSDQQNSAISEKSAARPSRKLHNLPR